MTTSTKENTGQALVEYIFIFAFVTFLGISMVKGLGNTMTNSVGFIGYELTEQLTVGVCRTECFYGGYINLEKGK